MSRQGFRSGLTLIELAVVVAILAILVGFLLPRLAFIRTAALHAGGGTCLQDTSNNLLTFHVTQGTWPHQFDSLVEADGTLYNGPINGLDANLAGVLEPVAVTTNELRSVTRLLGNAAPGGASVCGVMDHDETSTVAGNSGIVYRELIGASGTGLTLCRVRRTGNAADITTVSGAWIYDSIYPSGAPDPGFENLFALGVGPNCTAVNKTILQVPDVTMRDATRYNRVIVLFRIRADGVQAALAGTILPDGRTLSQVQNSYRETTTR